VYFNHFTFQDLPIPGEIPLALYQKNISMDPVGQSGLKVTGMVIGIIFYSTKGKESRKIVKKC
jgi:hypothetical protein